MEGRQEIGAACQQQRGRVVDGVDEIDGLENQPAGVLSGSAIKRTLVPSFYFQRVAALAGHCKLSNSSLQLKRGMPAFDV